MKKVTLTLSLIAIGLSACFHDKPSDSTNSNTTTLGKVQLSGVVSGLSSSPNGKPSIHSRGFGFSSSNLSGATVELVKRNADGTEQTVASTTTDANGSYSFSDVTATQTGTGSSSDYMYMIKAKSGDVTLSAPVATDADTTVDINPESNIAAKIITDVVDVKTGNDAALPDADTIEQLGLMVSQNMRDLSGSFTVIDSTTANDAKVDALANGLASAGGNAETMYKVYQFQTNLLSLVTNNTSTAAEVGALIKRQAREACGQQQGVNAVPYDVAEVLGTAIKNGTTYSASEIITAYNNSNGSLADVDGAGAVANYKAALTAVETNLAKDADTASAFTKLQQLAFYTKRDLDAATFASNTKLDSDQALAFLQYAVANGQEMNLCRITPSQLTATFGTLTQNSALTSAHIADAEIYQDSGFGCNDGNNEGHFRAVVDVYAPNASVTSVEISSSDTTALGGTGKVTLTNNNNRYEANSNGQCIKLGTAVTYTVTAKLGDGSSVTKSVTRNHARVPEAQTTYNSNSMSKNAASPTVVTEKRPTISWTPPATALTSVTNAPAGSQIKYTYEFSYIDTTGGQQAPLGQCGSVTSGGALYSVDSFMPTMDCDLNSCATTSGKSATALQCRINIQTYLVDEADRLLGQGAGNFTFFCVDSNSDGSCN